MRLRVDLRGNRPLADAMLAHDEYRAVALGDAGNRALNLRFDGSERLCVPLPVLECSCWFCHWSFWIQPIH
jgi:hypothetical protein